MQCFVAVHVSLFVGTLFASTWIISYIGSHNIKYIGQRYKLNRLLSDFLGANTT